jgi:hypothetical protein
MFSALVAVAALTLASPAVAATSSKVWYWSNSKARDTLLYWGLDYGDSYEEVVYAECYGRGRWIWNDPGTRKLFKKLVCYVETREDDPYWIRFDVRGHDAWAFEFLHYN